MVYVYVGFDMYVDESQVTTTTTTTTTTTNVLCLSVLGGVWHVRLWMWKWSQRAGWWKSSRLFDEPWTTTAASRGLSVNTLYYCKNDYCVQMTSHCAGTVQMREESESGIRKWEEMWFRMTAEDTNTTIAATPPIRDELLGYHNNTTANAFTFGLLLLFIVPVECDLF